MKLDPYQRYTPPPIFLHGGGGYNTARGLISRDITNKDFTSYFLFYVPAFINLYWQKYISAASDIFGLNK